MVVPLVHLEGVEHPVATSISCSSQWSTAVGKSKQATMVTRLFEYHDWNWPIGMQFKVVIP